MWGTLAVVSVSSFGGTVRKYVLPYRQPQFIYSPLTRSRLLYDMTPILFCVSLCSAKPCEIMPQFPAKRNSGNDDARDFKYDMTYVLLNEAQV